MQLPDLDGFEVAARLQALGDGTAIVLTSSRDRSDFGDAVAESPARGFIAKGELSGAPWRSWPDERPAARPASRSASLAFLPGVLASALILTSATRRRAGWRWR